MPVVDLGSLVGAAPVAPEPVTAERGDAALVTAKRSEAGRFVVIRVDDRKAVLAVDAVAESAIWRACRWRPCRHCCMMPAATWCGDRLDG